ncbi:MAG: hypothetical protein AB8B78_11790 [Polaribacter sp.]
MKILITIIWVLFLVAFVFFRIVNYWIEYKNKQVGKKYCEENSLSFLKVKHYEMHTRIYFKKDEIESWANYETDRKYNITWKKESPIEKIQNKKKNK